MGSVAEPRYCANVERCVKYDSATHEPEKLSRYNHELVCEACQREKVELSGGESHILTEGPAAKEPPTDLSRCSSCGKPDVRLLDAWVCEECAAEVRARGFVWEPYAPTLSDPPVVDRFEELFRAARVLLKNEAPQIQVFPTLAFAGYALGHGIEDLFAEKARLVKAWGVPQAWETEVDRFVSRFPSARPVQIIDDVLILEQEPVSIQVVNYPHTDIPELVEIHIYHGRKHIEPEEIARRYKQKLSSAGIACDVGGRRLPMSTEPFEGHVIITVANHKHDVPPSHAEAVFQGERPRFQHPDVVGDYCARAIGPSSEQSKEFARYLNRSGGNTTKSSKWLVPASVTLCLQDIAEIEDKKKIYQLLNEYVYGQKRFLGDGSDAGNINTLWDYVDKKPTRVRVPLSAAMHAFRSP